MNNSPAIRRIAVVCFYHFPEGMAASTRILAYCRGLVQNQVECGIFTFAPHTSEMTTPVEGEVAGVKYRYVHCRPAGTTKLYRLLVDRPRSFLAVVRTIRREHHRLPFDVVLLSFDSIYMLLFYVPLLRWIAGVRLAFIGDEYPYPIRHRLASALPWWRRQLLKVGFMGISARIVMTRALADFFNQQISPRPTFILPTIIDSERFQNIRRCPADPPFLCYMGNMELSKDNVDNIIRAFALVAEKYPDIQLRLYGTPTPRDLELLRTLVERLKLSSRVVFGGRVGYQQVPRVLAEARVLVSSQPATRRAEGGFPTKLGEYLQTGVPVLLTEVGEIGSYIRDGENGFLAPPDDPAAYAARLSDILDDYDAALRIAEAGRRFVRQFNCGIVGEKFKDFLSGQFAGS